MAKIVNAVLAAGLLIWCGTSHGDAAPRKVGPAHVAKQPSARKSVVPARSLKAAKSAEAPKKVGFVRAAATPKKVEVARAAAKTTVPPKHGSAAKRETSGPAVRAAVSTSQARSARSPKTRVEPITVARPAKDVRHLVQLQTGESDPTGALVADPKSTNVSRSQFAAPTSHSNSWLSALKWPSRVASLPPPRPLRSTSSRMPDLRSYEPVAVDVPRAQDVDPGLVELLGKLRGAVAANDIAPVAAALAADLKVIDCDSDATRPCPAAPSLGGRRARPSLVASLEPEQRLLQSMCCADMRPHDVPGRLRQDAVLDLLSTVIDSGSLGRHPDTPEIVCSPAQPAFDREKALEMAAASDTDPGNLRFASKEIVLHQQPSTDAPEVGRMAAHQMVPVVTDLSNPLPDGWNAVALPGGTLVYAQPQGLDDLATNAACFKKNEAGVWQIINVVRRHRWGGLG